MRSLGLFLAGLLIATPASAREEIPDDDIYGFTSPAEIGEPGDTTLAIENTARLGKARGSFANLGTKFQFGYTFTETLWGSVSVYNTFAHVKRLPQIGPDRERDGFDGVSTEWDMVLLPRDPSFPLMVTLSVEPGVGRLDPMSGRNDLNVGANVRLAADYPITPEIFAAANVFWQPNWALSHDTWIRSSSAGASIALTGEITEGLMVGAEARYLAAYDRLFLERNAGRALFIGPNAVWQISDHLSVNVAYTPQVWGKGRGMHQQQTNTRDFERSVARLKVVITF